jgi:hypothetical protein
LSHHKSQEDITIKAQHRVGSGPLQVALPQELSVDELERSEDEDGDEDSPAVEEEDPPGDGFEDEQFGQESYNALK